MEGAGDIDRLIERGLQLYGHGDVDGALRAWQQALAVDPDDARAAAYVDYVRENYQLLVSERRPVDEDEIPFGLGAVPGDGEVSEYEVEVTRSGENPRAAIEKYLESIDEGWVLADDASRPVSRPSIALPLPALADAEPDPEGDAEAEAITLEIEAEEPEREPPGEDDFADQRSAATQEIHAPRGFVQPRLDPVPPPGDDADDDRLKTRPGRTTGPSVLDGIGELRTGLASEAIHSLTGDFGAGASLGPDERTREQPAVSVTFEPETGDLPLDGRAPEPRFPDEERTSELRAPRRTIPVPLDAGPGAQPPLVIVEEVPPPTKPAFDTEGDTRRLPRLQTDRGLGKVGPPPSRPRTTTEELAAKIDRDLEAKAPPREQRSERTRRRVSELIDLACNASNAGDHGTAVVALDLALAEEPDSAVAQKLIHRHQPAILDVYQRFLGDLDRRPALAVPMHELSAHKLDIRAAFLLSRIDGALSFEEILDVAGMQRAEAFRHLSMLVLRGILDIR